MNDADVDDAEFEYAMALHLTLEIEGSIVYSLRSLDGDYTRMRE